MLWFLDLYLLTQRCHKTPLWLQVISKANLHVTFTISTASSKMYPSESCVFVPVGFLFTVYQFYLKGIPMRSETSRIE